MKKQGLLSFFLLFCLVLHGSEKMDFDRAVRRAVERQMQRYPKSTLKDLYKNFFQDQYGPGHLVADTAAAGKYLRQELASYTALSGEVAESTGWKGNFLRVNLWVVKTNQIPYPVFFDAFLRSVNGIDPLPVAEWQKRWNRIEAIIRSMNLPLPSYEEDRKEIQNRLDRGEYVGHHSKVFEDTYRPHYRIIRKEIFEKELLPLLSR